MTMMAVMAMGLEPLSVAGGRARKLKKFPGPSSGLLDMASLSGSSFARGPVGEPQARRRDAELDHHQSSSL